MMRATLGVFILCLASCVSPRTADYRSTAFTSKEFSVLRASYREYDSLVELGRELTGDSKEEKLSARAYILRIASLGREREIALKKLSVLRDTFHLKYSLDSLKMSQKRFQKVLEE